MDFQIYLENSNLEILNTADLPSGKKFKSRFIQAGLAGYPQQYGNVLIKKESLDKFVNTLETKPVIINHQEVTANNVNEIEVGRVHNVWFNEEDGWYWCDGVITNQKAIDLIDKGWSVSCSYNVSNYSDKGGTENNIKYDMEFLDGNFTHLAIVKNPRYEGADIVVVNSMNINNEEGKWITVHPNGEDSKGVHVFVKKGQSVDEAIEKLDDKKENKTGHDSIEKLDKEAEKLSDFEKEYWKAYKETSIPPYNASKEFEDLTKRYDKLDKKEDKKEEKKKEDSRDVTKEEFSQIKDKVSKMSDDELVKTHFEAQKGYESEKARAGSLTKHEATYGIVAQELKKRTGRSFSTSSTEREIKEALKQQSEGGEKKNRGTKRVEKIKEFAKKIKESPDYNAEYARETIEELSKYKGFGEHYYDIEKQDLIKEGHGDALAYIGEIFGEEKGSRPKQQEKGFNILRDIVREDLTEDEKNWVSDNSLTNTIVSALAEVIAENCGE